MPHPLPRPIRAWPHSTSKAATLLSGQRKTADTFSPHSASVNWILKYNLPSVRYWCGVIFSLPYWRKGWVYFIRDGRLEERSGRGGYDTVHLTFTHIHNTWYMASQRILLNLYCSWGQALNSPLKEHNGSSDRAHGISVYRAGLRLFHPVQDVTSCRRFFLQKCYWPELFAAVWLTHESVRWEQAEQAAPPALHQSETVQDP